jgi:hypothetical protein
VVAVSGHWDRPDRPRCKATSTRTGQQCQAYPVRGAQVCAAHGGRAPQVKAAARRRLEVERVEADVAAVLAFEGVTPIADPLEELGKLTAEVVAFKDALSARVNALREVRYSAPGSGAEQLRAEVQLLERAQDRAGRLLALLVSSGFQERRVRIEERQGQLVGVALKQIFARLQLSEYQQELVGVVVPEELRRLAAAEAVVEGRVLP